MARIPDRDVLLREVPEDGSSVGNYALMEQLKWDEGKYWRVRDQLVDEGVLVTGRGRGGSVRRAGLGLVAETEAAPRSTSPAVASPRPPRESDLYDPISRVLRESWRVERRLTQVYVEITAHQGRRATGGTWTRPDLTALSLKTYSHVPGKFHDVWTFEVKPREELDVTGVFEAAAHSRFSHRATVMFHVIGAELPEAQQETLERCVDEARRFGVGVVTFTEPSDLKTWDFVVQPERHDPDPERLETFIATQLSVDARAAWQQMLR